MTITKTNKLSGHHLIKMLTLVVLLFTCRFLWNIYAPNNDHFDLGLQIILAVVMLLHGIYTILLFIASRERKELIPFAAFILINSFSILIDDNQALLYVTNLSEEWTTRLLYLTFILASAALIRFTQLLSKTYRQTKFSSGLYMAIGICTLLLLFIPFELIGIVIPSVLIINVASFSYALLIIFQIFLYEDKLAFTLILVAICNLHNLTWGAASNWGFDLIYYPFDYLFTLFGLVIFLGRRFLNVSNEHRKLSEELQILNQEKVEFLANTSHELRNPLHGIINIAESVVMTNQEKLNEESKENLELIASLGRYMGDTLNDLLDQPINPNKQIRLNQQRIHLENIVALSIQAVASLASNKNIVIKADIPENLPAIWGDKSRIRQILFNLLHNATKYTEHKGTITLKATVQDEFIQISVIDTGIGIKEESMETIFEPYEQESHDQIGTGLGLSICRKLVQLHGGELTVESEVNIGSTFTFTMPIATTAHQEEKARTLQYKSKVSPTEDSIISLTPSVEELQEANLPRILVVDDDHINLKILYDLLSDAYAVTCVDSGEKAAELLKTTNWDLIISDVQMPGMDGYELTRNIRARFSLFELPIILLTARTDTEDIQTGFRSGANDYVKKPMNRRELRARVEVLTKLKKSVEAKSRMEAAWLQAQIQPHFLFNTLNTITSLGHIDIDRMIRLLNEFGIYLQHSFHINNVRGLVPLHQELALLKSYLYIEKERFGDRLEIKYDLDDTLQIKIPPLSIQPIVENAVRHGILQKMEGGTVTIAIKEQTKAYTITIHDNGVGIPKGKLKTLLDLDNLDIPSIGLRNTHRRLIQLYGKGLTIKSQVNIGTTISFTIPKNLHINKQKDE